MFLKSILYSKSTLDFLYMFLSNVLQKLFGLIRELIIAFFFGTSMLYSNFLLLRIIADLFSQFTAGNALKANLLPKLTKIYKEHDNVSLDQVFRFSKSTTIYIFFITQIIHTFVILLLNVENNLLFFSLSFILSFSICFNFLNTILLTILQAKGLFLRFSFASTLNSAIFTLLTYPLVSIFSIVGLALSRFFGILSTYLVYLNPMNNSSKGHAIKLNTTDFNIPTLVLGNFANIIIICSRFVAGSSGTNDIAFFMYAIVILNSLLTAVIGNISTILLRNISINRNHKSLITSLLITCFVGFLMIMLLYFFSYDIVKFIYFRGAFTMHDVQQTSIYLYDLCFGFLLLFVATILFQPFLSLSISRTRIFRNRIVIFFIISLLLSSSIVFFDFNPMFKSLFAMYTSSSIVLALSIYSYLIYCRHVD